MIFGRFFDRRPLDERLDVQKKTLDDVGDLVKKASEEITVIKNQLVKKANGSLYPTGKLK